VFWEISLNVILMLVSWEEDPFLVAVFANINVLSFDNSDPTFADQGFYVIFDSLVAIPKSLVILNATMPMLKKVLHQ